MSELIKMLIRNWQGELEGNTTKEWQSKKKILLGEHLHNNLIRSVPPRRIKGQRGIQNDSRGPTWRRKSPSAKL